MPADLIAVVRGSTSGELTSPSPAMKGAAPLPATKRASLGMGPSTTRARQADLRGAMVRECDGVPSPEVIKSFQKLHLNKDSGERVLRLMNDCLLYTSPSPRD